MARHPLRHRPKNGGNSVERETLKGRLSELCGPERISEHSLPPCTCALDLPCVLQRTETRIDHQEELKLCSVNSGPF